jgi:heat shock protein HtpX
MAIGYALGEYLAQGAGVLGMGVGLIVAGCQYLTYLWAAESIIMAGMGAQELSREQSPRLFNIVEEMQLASGLGFTPKIFLIDADQPNAFALGRKPETSALAVTSGLLYRLNRDELQGVIGHEVGHLANEDTRFMALAAVLMGSIVVMADMTQRLFYSGSRYSGRSSSRGKDNNGGNAIMLIVLLVLVILGPILARLLYFAVSRSREFLADACSAEYTRYPEGLASALLAISSSTGGLSIANKANAPMFIINPLAPEAVTSSAFSSHPSTMERVQVLRAMQGSGYLDYDRAYRAVMGKGILGNETIQQSGHSDSRAGSEEGPIMTRPGAAKVSQVLNGYVETTCQCGAKLRVPTSYELPTIRCIRCGAVNPVPRATVPISQGSLASGAASGDDIDVGANSREGLPAIEYTRIGTGWESFRCDCGGTVQLSPQFSGSSVHCPRCNRKIIVHSPGLQVADSSS